MQYNLYHTKLIEENFESFLNDTNIVYENLKNNYSSDTTRTYGEYNLFVESSASLLYYYLYRDLCHCIRDFHRRNGGSDSDPIWMQSWLNYHSNDNVKSLDWHSHDADFHGYISIDPKNTVTMFSDFVVENKTGLIYLGKCGKDIMKHKVSVNKPYEGHRITIAFDCIFNRGFTPHKFIPIL